MSNTPTVRRRAADARRRSVGHRPTLEGLEDRIVLSGVAVDNVASRLLTFNDLTGTQTGLVSLPTSSGSLSDAVISPDKTLAYVSDFYGQRVWVVDLTTNSLASGTNPISVPTFPEDLALTPDGKFLLVTDGTSTDPIVVVNTTTRTVASTLYTGTTNIGIDVTKNGDVLVGVGGSQINHYVLNTAGALTFSGQTLGGGYYFNTTAAPNGLFGVTTDGSGRVTSFAVSGMAPKSTINIPDSVVTLAFDLTGSRLYVRGGAHVYGFNYDSTTGAIDSLLFTSVTLSGATGYFGVDQLDASIDGSRIYTSSGGSLVALNATTGAVLGNISVSGAEFAGVNVSRSDKTPPVTTASGSGTNGDNGWYRSAVNVSLSAADDASGVAATFYRVNGGPQLTYTAPFSVSTAGTDTVTYWSVDRAGNVEATRSLTLKIDITPPTISAQRTPAANGHGWNNTDVLASYLASDGVSGLASPATGTFTFNADGAGQSHTFTVTDLAGNSSSITIGGINIDKTAPTISGAATTAPNANGWYNGDVVIHWTATDGGAGIDPATVPADTIITAEGANLGASAAVHDLAGNTTAASLDAIEIDRTRPTATILSGPMAVTNSTSAAFTFDGSDALSGVEHFEYRLDDGDWTATVTTSADLSGLAGGSHSFALRAVDRAGNVSVVDERSWTVDRATAIGLGAASSTYGGSTTLKASLTWHGDGSALGGETIAFTINGTAVGTAVTDGDGVAVLSNVSLSGLDAGTYATAVGASFTGDIGYTGSTGTGSLVIAKAAPVVTVTAVAATYDGSAHGTTGTVTGVDGESLGAAAIVYSGGSTPMNVGSYTATGAFDGNDNYLPAAGSAGIQIDKAASTTTVEGGTFTYDGAGHGATSASVAGAGGLVAAPALVYKDAGGTVFAGLPTSAGSYTVCASYPGDGNHTASAASAAIVIDKAASSTSVAGGTFTFDGTAHGATGAAVTGAGGLSAVPALTYKDADGNTLAGPPIGAGSYTVCATYAGDANHGGSSATAAIDIVKATPTVTVVGGSFTYDGQEHGATGSVAGVNATSLGTPTFTYSYTDESGNAVTMTSAPVEPGYYTVTAAFAGDANYKPASATATLMIAFEVRTLTDLSKAFKSGRTIPIKLQLTDASGNNVSSSSIDVTALRLEQVNADGSTTQVALQDAGSANPDNLFRYDAALGGYVFNLSTKGLVAGTYDFYWAAEEDPTEHELSFNLV